MQSHTVFLSGSSVWHRSVDEIAALLSVIRGAFPITPRTRRTAPNRAEQSDRPRFDGVHGFVDDFASPMPDRADWSALVEGGLLRISLGVESGAEEIRRLYERQWADDDLCATVDNIRASGIGISVLVLVGAGGPEGARSHVDSTARLIDSLNLGAGDFVFLLDENEIGNARQYPQGAPLRGAAWSKQQAELKTALSPLKKRGVKVLLYTLEKQWT
jgi:hypothetical protein